MTIQIRKYYKDVGMNHDPVRNLIVHNEFHIQTKAETVAIALLNSRNRLSDTES